MIERCEIETARCAVASNFDVRGFVGAVGHRIVQQIRQTHQPFVGFGLHGNERRFATFEFGGELLATLQQRTRILTLTLRHTDGLSVPIPLGADPIGFDLRLLTSLFERTKRR